MGVRNLDVRFEHGITSANLYHILLPRRGDSNRVTVYMEEARARITYLPFKWKHRHILDHLGSTVRLSTKSSLGTSIGRSYTKSRNRCNAKAGKAG
jgi:hypothetical protein